VVALDYTHSPPPREPLRPPEAAGVSLVAIPGGRALTSRGQEQGVSASGPARSWGATESS
jgi:hypothetical protein